MLTVAGPDADGAVRRSYQLGADRGVRVSDDAIAGSDYFGTARVLAAAVRRLADEAPVDVVVTGMAALDGLGSVVPALLSAELGCRSSRSPGSSRSRASRAHAPPASRASSTASRRSSRRRSPPSCR